MQFNVNSPGDFFFEKMSSVVDVASTTVNPGLSLVRSVGGTWYLSTGAEFLSRLAMPPPLEADCRAVHPV